MWKLFRLFWYSVAFCFITVLLGVMFMAGYHYLAHGNYLWAGLSTGGFLLGMLTVVFMDV